MAHIVKGLQYPVLPLGINPGHTHRSGILKGFNAPVDYGPPIGFLESKGNRFLVLYRDFHFGGFEGLPTPGALIAGAVLRVRGLSIEIYIIIFKHGQPIGEAAVLP